MSEEIKDVIGALDTNIKNLEEADEINMKDVQTLLLDLFGVMRDLWEKLGDVFIKAKGINDIDEATSKGKQYEKKEIKDPEIKRLYI